MNSSFPPVVSMAMRLLPRAKRHSVRLILEWHVACGERFATALASGGAECHRVFMALQHEAMQIGGDAEPADAVLRPFWEIGRTHGGKRSIWIGVVDGWNALATRGRYRDWAQLRAVLQSLAIGPARLVLSVLGTEESMRVELAEALGIGVMHSVLIQRLGDGIAHGRISVPDDEMERFRVSASDIADRRVTPQFQDLMWFETKRLREQLDVARARLNSIPNDGSRAFVGTLIDWQYEMITRLEKNGFRVFDTSVEFSRWEAVKFVLARRRNYSDS